MSAESTVCPACGGAVPANALLCPSCGKPNISSAFAAPSQDVARAQAPYDGSLLAAGVPHESDSSYAGTGIPKTVMPWETAPQQEKEPQAQPEQQISVQPRAKVALHSAQVGQGAVSTQGQYPAQHARQIQQSPAQYTTYHPSQQQYYNRSAGRQVYRYRKPGGASGSSRYAQTAANLEYLGFIGLLGLGHIYAGFTFRGIALFLGWLVMAVLLVQWFIMGEGLCLLIPALAVPVISSRWVAWSIKNSNAPPGRY